MPGLRVTAALVVAAAGLGLSGCGGATPNASTLLHRAKQLVDTAPAVHFELSSTGVQCCGALITGGSGDAKRPASFSGTLDVQFSGLEASIRVVSVGGVFYAQLPTSAGFTRTNPANYGFGDPARLLDPQHGLSSLLLLCGSPHLGSDDRYQGSVLHEVSCSLPGHAIASLLVDAQPSQPVAATFGIDSQSGQLRRVVLNGPFFSTQPSTFTLILDNYGENVTVTPPPAAS